jgi:hypothetical protein
MLQPVADDSGSSAVEGIPVPTGLEAGRFSISGSMSLPHLLCLSGSDEEEEQGLFFVFRYEAAC